MFVTILVLCLGAALASEEARYDNYRIYELTADSEKHLQTLHELSVTSDSLIFLVEGRNVGDKFSVIVAPHKLADFTATLEIEGIRGDLMNTNVQRSIDEEKQRVLLGRKKGVFSWTEYHQLEEIHAWLNKLAAENEQVELLDIGYSNEKRRLRGVKLSYKSGNPGIFIEGGMHAREWISPAVVTYILNELLTSNDTSVRNIAENYDWYIFPNANPDGYVYTFRRNRFWRKTRTPYPGGCFGADPNRNWDFYWMEQGTSDRCTSDIYGGPTPFSEIETRTLSDYITSLKGKIQVYLSFHAYSQLLLFPYGHTGEHAPNHDDLNEIANATAVSLAKRYGTKYVYGNVYDAIYPASGSSIDWAYGTSDVKISYTYELRPNSDSWYGFLLPAREIIPTGEETLDSLVTLVEESAKRGYF